MALKVTMTAHEMRVHYENGGQIAEIMAATGLDYGSVLSKLQSVGTPFVTGGYGSSGR